jgi:hypothetical protein
VRLLVDTLFGFTGNSRLLMEACLINPGLFGSIGEGVVVHCRLPKKLASLKNLFIINNHPCHQLDGRGRE